MSLKTWWDEDICGPWTENKLISRKWLTVIAFAVVAVGLDVAGRALQEATVNAVRDAVIAFVGVQGFIDMVKYRVVRAKQKGDKK